MRRDPEVQPFPERLSESDAPAARVPDGAWPTAKASRRLFKLSDIAAEGSSTIIAGGSCDSIGYTEEQEATLTRHRLIRGISERIVSATASRSRLRNLCSEVAGPSGSETVTERVTRPSSRLAPVVRIVLARGAR